tara:strand:- start:147 stop:317 length:171 start_codon:yes stop_codon:yes gene_type:complete
VPARARQTSLLYFTFALAQGATSFLHLVFALAQSVPVDNLWVIVDNFVVKKQQNNP